MRRVTLLLPLLAMPAMAQAQDAFCRGLLTVTEAASSGAFDYLPREAHAIPGSIAERRGVTATQDGPPRAILYALMLRDEAARRPNPVAARFHALSGEITRCLPQAEALPVVEGQGGAVATWRLQRAIVALRRDDGMGGASTAEVELSVASRW